MNRRTILPRPPRTPRETDSYEEVDWDELTRTSLSTSVDELIETHRRDLESQAQARAREVRARELSLAQERAREVAAEERRLRVAQERGRMLSLQRRERVARQVAAREAQPWVDRILQGNEHRLRLNSKQAHAERIAAAARVAAQRRSLQKAFTATLVAATLGAFATTFALEGAQKRHELQIGQLLEQTTHVQTEAELRTAELKKRLEEGANVSEEKQRKLRKALAEVRSEIAAEGSSDPQTRTVRAAETVRVRAAGPTAPARPSTTGQTDRVALAEELPEPTVCLDGDPLCFGL